MEGLLYKWTNYINGWQLRYFSLRDGVLSYYNSEVEVGLGCKGAVKVAVCEVIVSPSDNCRLDILDPGTQRFYLRARTPLERQKWIIALGSCKAGLSLPDNFLTLEIQQAIAEKRSELRVYRDLLFQQINDLKKNLDERSEGTPVQSKDVEETTENLKATCDTFLATSDELIRLLTSSGPSSLPATAAKRSSGGPTSDGPQFSPDSRTRKLLIPSNLQSTATVAQYNGNISSEPDQDARLEPDSVKSSTVSISEKTTTKSERKSSSKKDSGDERKSSRTRLSNGTLINAHLRSLRLTRPFQTFFSVMEFSFEDIPPTITADRLRAIEFLASSRSLLKFFNILATTDDSGQPVLSRLGSLQTVYADVMGNIVRLELAVSTLCEEKKSDCKNSAENTKKPASFSSESSDSKLKTLETSLQDIISAEVQAHRCREKGSAYFALLWLCRALNFASDFIAGLFADYTTAGEPSGASVTTHVQTAATNAYARTLRPFHDWTLRNTAMVIIQSIPSFERIKSILLLIDDTAPSAALMQPSAEALAQLQLDADRYALALKRCLKVVHAAFLQLRLEPILPPESAIAAANAESAAAGAESDSKVAPPVS